MKLFGAAMVRNEADIVEAFVRHNLTVLDGLAIVDHGSFDGTSEILAALVAEGLPLAVTRNDTLGYYQPEITTQLVRDVFARTPADYVCVVDADEFLHVRSRRLLDEVLAGPVRGLHAVIHWQTYVPDFFAAAAGDDACTRIRSAKRLAQERNGLRKVIVGRHFAGTAAAMIAMGNHFVVPAAGASGPGQSNPHARLKPELARLAHVPIRGRDQFTCKIAVGWLAHVAADRDSPATAYHWREAYAELKAGRALTPELLTAIASNYSIRKRDWLPAAAIAYVSDPFLADFELRYTHLGRGDPLPLVLAFAEKLAAAA